MTVNYTIIIWGRQLARIGSSDKLTKNVEKIAIFIDVNISVIHLTNILWYIVRVRRHCSTAFENTLSPPSYPVNGWNYYRWRKFNLKIRSHCPVCIRKSRFANIIETLFDFSTSDRVPRPWHSFAQNSKLLAVAVTVPRISKLFGRHYLIRLVQHHGKKSLNSIPSKWI